MSRKKVAFMEGVMVSFVWIDSARWRIFAFTRYQNPLKKSTRNPLGLGALFDWSFVMTYQIS